MRERFSLIKNALCIDVDDLVGSCQEAGLISMNEKQYHVDKETEYLLDSLEKLNIQATFFIPGFVTSHFPNLVQEISKRNHEIASHGTQHIYVKQFSPQEFAEDIKKSKNRLEDLSGKKIDIYKAPIWGIFSDTLWALDVLVEQGFRYDNTLMPKVLRPLGKSVHEPVYFENGLISIPPTHGTLGRFLIPLYGGFYNAYIPERLQFYFFSRMNQKGIPFNFYFHPFEFRSNHSLRERYQLNFRTGLYSHHAGRYESLLPRLSQKFKLTTLSQAYSEVWNKG